MARQQVARLTTEIIPKVSGKVDCVFQSHQTLETFLDSIINLKKQYIKVRLVTEITRDNLPYYKEVNKHIDIRHLDSVKGSFIVCDGREYSGIHIWKTVGACRNASYYYGIIR